MRHIEKVKEKKEENETRENWSKSGTTRGEAAWEIDSFSRCCAR